MAASRLQSYGSSIDAVADADRANAQLQLNRAAQAQNLMQSGQAVLERARTRENAQRNFDLNYMLQKEQLALNERRVKAQETLNNEIRAAELQRRKLEDKLTSANKVVGMAAQQAKSGLATGESLRKLGEQFANDGDLLQQHQTLLGMADDLDIQQDEDAAFSSAAAERANAALQPTLLLRNKARDTSKAEAGRTVDPKTGQVTYAQPGFWDKIQNATGLGTSPDEARAAEQRADAEVASGVQGVFKELGRDAPFVRWNPKAELFEPTVMPAKRPGVPRGTQGTESSPIPSGGGGGAPAPTNLNAAPPSGSPSDASVTPIAPKMVTIRDPALGVSMQVPKDQFNADVARLMRMGHTEGKARGLAIRAHVERSNNEHSNRRAAGVGEDYSAGFDANIGWTGY